MTRCLTRRFLIQNWTLFWIDGPFSITFLDASSLILWSSQVHLHGNQDLVSKQTGNQKLQWKTVDFLTSSQMIFTRFFPDYHLKVKDFPDKTFSSSRVFNPAMLMPEGARSPPHGKGNISLSAGGVSKEK